VKLSTLLEIIGSGSVLLVVGVGVFFVGLGYGFSEATGLPLWASFCGLGLFAAIVGYVLIDRGSDQAEEHVKAMSPMFEAFRSPWLIVGAGIVGGIVLQRLLRGRRGVIVENKVAVPCDVGSLNSQADPAPPSTEQSKTTGFSFSQYVGDQLRTLGTVASEAAVAMAIQSLGIPSVREIVDDLLGSKEQEDEPNADASAPSDRGGGAKEYAHATRGSTTPSHNGFNRPGEFDPTL